IYTPGEIVARLREQLPANRAALVFGREDSGLTTDEVALCRWQSTIPTSGEYGSLNLAQSVLIYCYELLAGFSAPAAEEVRELAPGDSLEEMYGQMERTLLRIGYLNPQNPAHLMRSLRRIFARAALDQREVTIVRGMMSQIDWAASEFRGKKGA
ncbi:MAG TPA: TrmH family RNA methyltransferase, partial [Geobacteraceae bacterium]